MGRSCGEIVLIVIVGIAALNLLFATFGWNGLMRQGGTRSNEDPAEDLHIALENLRKELRLIHNALPANISHHMNTIPSTKPSRADGLPSINENSAAVHKEDFPTPVLKRNSSRTPKSVVIFTMDSIGSYEKNSLSGGAAGELTVRRSLEHAFRHFGAKVDVLRSDEEFNRCNLKAYDIIILDPWTWAAKGWVPKKSLVGLDSKVYMLDFFGTKGGLRGPAPGQPQKGLVVPPERFLTAFGSPDNTFLGYFMPNTSSQQSAGLSKLQQGVIWGKDVKHFGGKEKMLQAVAREATLVSTATSKVVAHDNIRWVGHQTTAGWMDILRQSRFLIGLGNPILGPSAIDAVSVGCVFINPVYQKPVVVNGYSYSSQHPYAEGMGAPYVCNYRQGDAEELRACIRAALKVDLPIAVPKAFTLEAHLARVQRIFDL